MKKFKQFYLGGHKWIAYLVSPRSKYLLLDGEHKAGICDYETCRIFVANNQSESDRNDTFLHEVIHALLYVTGTKEKFSYEEEEKFVMTVTPVLHRWLTDFGFSFPQPL